MTEAERRIARAVFEMRNGLAAGVIDIPKYIRILEDQHKEN